MFMIKLTKSLNILYQASAHPKTYVDDKTKLRFTKILNLLLR